MLSFVLSRLLGEIFIIISWCFFKSVVAASQQIEYKVIFFFSLQYVEKLEKILRFVIKEKALSLDDLDNIWAAQVCGFLFFVVFLSLINKLHL